MQVKIIEKISETPEVSTLVLQPVAPATLRYRPGQYLPVIYTSSTGQEVRRAYSFSSCPEVDPLPAVTIRRIPNGAVSSWLVQQAQPGDILKVAEPAGLFTLPPHLPDTLVYIAAGSGITPVISHLKALLETDQYPTNRSIVLLYANRDVYHTIFKYRIDQYADQYPGRFFRQYVFSRQKEQPDSFFGHLNNSLLRDFILNRWNGQPSAADRANTRFYLCAPKPIMRMAEMTLRVLDFPAENIIKESFAADTRLPVRVINPAITHRVTAFRNGQHIEFDVFEGETILNGALRQGINLPYTCKSGVCFSCLAQCTSGKTEVTFVEETLRKGPGDWVNTCIAYATTPKVSLSYE